MRVVWIIDVQVSNFDPDGREQPIEFPAVKHVVEVKCGGYR